MKTFLISILAGLVAPLTAMAQPSRAVVIRVENPSQLERRDETVAVAWADVRRLLPAASAAKIRLVDATSRQEIVTQAYDHDADGQPDSLLFQVTLSPGA